MKLVAVKKFTYATRRLQAGDAFDASSQDGRALVALGRAKVRAPQPTEPEPRDEVALLRAEYERVLGGRPFMGWDADTLREKIANA